MDRLELLSYAKVNLSLDVMEKRRTDGYHYLKTVMVPISLADRIVLERSDRMTLECRPPLEGRPEENLAYRAAELLKRVTGYQGEAAISIQKVIPVAGGLAGGSTNAATTLAGLNRLWGTGLGESQLIDLAIRLGSDVPFFIPSRPARVEGIGERLTPLRVARPLWMVVATPNVEKSTANVYRLFDELTEVEHPDTATLEESLACGDHDGVVNSLGNVFEQVMLPRHPEIKRLKELMLANGAKGALMSGAGPTVFGIVPDEAAGQALLRQVRGEARMAHLVHTVVQ